MAKKTPSGKYRGRVQIGVDKDGKPLSKYVASGRIWEFIEHKPPEKSQSDQKLLVQYVEDRNFWCNT